MKTETETKVESNSLPACRWEVSILIEAINTLNEFPAVSGSSRSSTLTSRMRDCRPGKGGGTQRILLVLPGCPLRGIFAPIEVPARLSASFGSLAGPRCWPCCSRSRSRARTLGLLSVPACLPTWLLCYAYFQQTIPIRAAIVAVVQSVIKVL